MRVHLLWSIPYLLEVKSIAKAATTSSMLLTNREKLENLNTATLNRSHEATIIVNMNEKQRQSRRTKLLPC